jgi:mono/diheme cytochrome c family protein
MYLLTTLLMAYLLGSQAPPQTSGSPPARPDSGSAGNAENGKKLYSAYGCYQCHGYASQGGVGPRLAPRPLVQTAFSKYVRQPTGEMPPYTVKVLSDSQLRDIYAFLQAVPQPPSVESIPLLKDN